MPQNNENEFDKKLAIAAVKNDWRVMGHLSKNMQGDKDIVLAAIEHQYNDTLLDICVRQPKEAIEYLSDELKNDKDVAFAAVKKNWKAIKSLGKEMQDNKEVALVLLQSNNYYESWQAIEHLSDRLKNDKDIAIAAVKKNAEVIKSLGKEMQDNKEVALVLLQSNNYYDTCTVIEYLSDRLKNDKDVALAAIKRDWKVIKSLGKDMQNNKEVAIVAIEKNVLAIQHLSKELKNNKDIAFAVVAKDYGATEYLGEDIKKDKDILFDITVQLLEFVDQKNINIKNHLSIKNHLEKLIDEKNMAIAAVKRNTAAVKYLGKDMREDKDVALALFEGDKFVSIELVECLSDELKNDQDIAILAVKSDWQVLPHLGKDMKRNKEVALTIYEESDFVFAKAMEYFSNELRHDKDIAIAAVKRDQQSIKYLDKDMQNDKEVALAAITGRCPSIFEKDDKHVFEYLSDELKNDKDVAIAAVKVCYQAFQHLSKDMQGNKEVALAFFEGNKLVLVEAVKCLSDELKNDKDVAIAAVKVCYQAFQHLSKDMQGNKEVALAFFEGNKVVPVEAVRCLSDELKNDKDIVLAVVEKDYHAIKYLVKKDIQEDKETVLATTAGHYPSRTRNNKHEVEYLSDELKNDKDIAIAVVKKDYHAFQHLGKDMQGNKEVALALFEGNKFVPVETVKCLSDELKNDKDVAIAAVKKNAEAIKYLGVGAKGDHNVALISILKDGSTIQHISSEIQGYRELAIIAVAQKLCNLKHINHEVKWYRDLVLSMLKIYDSAMQHKSATNGADWDVNYKKIVKQDDGTMLHHVLHYTSVMQYAGCSVKNDKEIALIAINNSWEEIKYFADSVRGDTEVALTFLKELQSFGLRSGSAIKYLGKNLQNNKEIVMSFLSKNPTNFEHLSQEMQQDQHVLLANKCSNNYNKPKITYKIDKNYYHSVSLNNMTEKTILCKFLSFGSLSEHISGSDSNKTLCDDLLNVIASYLDLKSLLAFRSLSVDIDSHIFKSYNYGISFTDSEYRHHLISKIEQDTNNEYIVTLANEEVDILGT